MKLTRKALALSSVLIPLTLGLVSCGLGLQQPESASGVHKLDVQVPVNPQTGRTVEQENIAKRLLRDNTPGAIKYLYVIAPESGQVIIMSPVKNKVTSSGKRLTPGTVNDMGFRVKIGNDYYYTAEVLGDDGTYGNSGEYLFWYDQNDVYHQHYLTGGQIIHVTDQPMKVNRVILNVETLSAPSK